MLKELLNSVGLPLTATDGTETTLRIDDRLTLELALTADHEHLTLRAVVGHLDPDADTARVREIAVANYAGATTGGGALGLNPVNGEVLLFRETALRQLDAALFETLLSRFIDAACLWQDVLNAAPGSNTGTVPSSSSSTAWVRA